MDIQTTRTSNIANLEILERYVNSPKGKLQKYYEELTDDFKLLAGINEKIEATIEIHGFTKGIFGKGKLSSLDWFAYQRVLIYVLIRYLKPQHILETGVFYGGNTTFLLAAAQKNEFGTVHSIDLPDSKIRALHIETGQSHARHSLVGDSELYDEALAPGFIIPNYLKGRWQFIEGSSLDIIPNLKHEFGFYLHDSDHSFAFLNKELSIASKRLTDQAIVVVDDLNWSNSFFKFCSERKLYPLLSTDNGKDNLMVRTGILKMDHPNNGHPDITG